MRPCRNVAHFVIIFCVDLTASWYPEETFWTNVRVVFDFLRQDCAVFSKLLASLVEFIPKYCILFNAKWSHQFSDGTPLVCRNNWFWCVDFLSFNFAGFIYSNDVRVIFKVVCIEDRIPGKQFYFSFFFFF